jgi:hypothetical protein
MAVNLPVARLGDVVEVTGGATPSKRNNDFWGGEIPWISPKDMKAFELDSSKDLITEEGLRNSACKLIPVGTPPDCCSVWGLEALVTNSCSANACRSQSGSESLTTSGRPFAPIFGILAEVFGMVDAPSGKMWGWPAETIPDGSDSARG